MSTGEWVLTAAVVLMLLVILLAVALTARRAPTGQRSTGRPITASGATAPPAPPATKGIVHGEGPAPAFAPIGARPGRAKFVLFVNPVDEDQVRAMAADETLDSTLASTTGWPVTDVEIRVTPHARPGQALLFQDPAK